MKKKYIVDGQVYEIPEAEVASFLKDFPNAEEAKSYNVKGSNYNIPLSKADEFETEMGLKKKEEPIASATGSIGFGGATTNKKSTSNTGVISPIIEADEIPEGQRVSTSIVSSVFGGKKKSPLGFTETLLNSIAKPTEFSLVPTKEQNESYSTIERAQIERVTALAQKVNEDSALGNVSADDLAELYQDSRGRDYANQIIERYVPEYMGAGLDKEVVGSGKKWNDIARKIKEKNRATGVDYLDQVGSKMDNDILDILSSSKATNILSSGGGGGGGVNVSTNDLPAINLNDPSEYSALINKVQQSTYLSGPDGKRKEGEKERLLELLQVKAMQLSQNKAMSPEIEALSGKIKNAVARVNMDRELGEDVTPENVAEADEIDARNFQTGLNYIQDVDPGKYKNIIRAIEKKEKVADGDFRRLALIGQEINNEKTFRAGATNPEMIDKETSFDYMTRQDKKSIYASAIGEYFKEQGFKNVRQFSPDMIRSAALKLGLNNQTIVDELAAEEGMIAYDAIPKTGKTEAFVRGLMTPFEGIRKTVDAVTTNDAAETYLKSQQFDVGIGGQKVSGGEGEMTTRLASDRGNLWYDVMEGFGQFVPQVLIARGIGSPIAGAARLGTGLVPRGALTAGQAANITNYGGTFISTYLQEYGSAYEDALQKTGDVNTARSMGAINGISAASFELFLPDTKIADRAMGIFRKNYAGDIIDIIKKGGGVENMARKGRGVIEKFVGETLGIVKQEVKEEVGTQLVNYITESIFSPKTAADRQLGDELLETARATAVSMLIPSVLGGAGSARTSTDFTVSGLHSAAVNIKTYKNSLEKAVIDDQITQEEMNLGMKVLNTHRESIDNSPKVSSSGKRLSTSERLEFAYQDTLIKGYNEQLKSASSDVAKEDINKKITKAEDVQRKILLPETAKGKDAADQSWQRRVIPIMEQEFLESEIPETEEEWKERIEVSQSEEEKEMVTKKYGEWQMAQGKNDPQFIKEQSLGAPNGLVGQLGSEEAVIDEIAKNSPEAIEGSIKDWMSRVKNEMANQADADQNISLLEKGLEKSKGGTSKKEGQREYTPSEKLRIEADQIQVAANMLPPEQMEVKEKMWAEAKDLRAQADQLDVAVTTPSMEGEPIEDKKADIEKRRDEELKTIPELEPLSTASIEKKELWDNREQVAADINAKYDAELAALSQPKQTPVEGGAAIVTPDQNRKPNVVKVQQQQPQPEVKTSKPSVVLPNTNKKPDVVPLKKEGGQDAVQEQSTTESVLRDEGIRREGGLQELEQDNQPEVAAEESQPVKEKVKASDRMRSVAAKIREKGLHEALPNWAKADLPEGTQQAGFGGTALDNAVAKAIEIVADAVDAGTELAAAISQGFDSLKEYYTANTKSFNEKRVRKDFTEGVNDLFNEEVVEDDATDDEDADEPQFVDDGPDGQDKQSEESGEYNFGERKFTEENDPIANHKLKTIDVDVAFGTELTKQLLWNDTPTEDRFKRQVDMLGDGKEMIGLAQTMFGGADVAVYGPELLKYLKAMPFSGDNKKAILMATFIGEIKNAMERTGDKNLQSLYATASLDYRNMMHVHAKNLAAGRLLRLFRDKYMYDIYQDVILEEEEIRNAKETKDKIDNTDISEKDAADHQHATQKGKSSTQVNKERKDDQDAKKKKAAESDGRKKGSKGTYDDLYKKKEAEVKAKYGTQSDLFQQIKDKIDKLNCP